ncbi:MAG: RDD family protein [Anaerolineae bacterium]|nr:RDD family protein [Anaerolineae bacterium]
MAKYGDVREALAQSELETARDLLRDYLDTEPESAEAWYLAAQAAVNDKQKRYFLEKAIDCDPIHVAAGLELHALTHATKDVLPLSATAPKPQIVTKAHLAPAPFLNRALAFIIDYAILIIMSFFLSILASLLTGAANNPEAAVPFIMLWMLLTTAAYIGYYGYSFTAWQGQTIGKRMMKVRVVKRNGDALGWSDAFLRCWIGYLLSMAPIGLGFWWALVDDDKRAWHDLITDTQVVRA